MTNIQSVASE